METCNRCGVQLPGRFVDASHHGHDPTCPSCRPLPDDAPDASVD
ncbi:hypothetical protein [Halomarina ordinaria]|uniref:Small CPxCG-related zinc finger protein n=1 Tax=Halomarina ordinaria TaxID=3033939 RepID=A0ABD5U869_9EURY|nr:hypothetical protein [Halomarina sp. PSRA2]